MRNTRNEKVAHNLINLTKKDITIYDAAGDFYTTHPYQSNGTPIDLNDAYTVVIVRSAATAIKYGNRTSSKQFAVVTQTSAGRDMTPISRLVNPFDGYPVYYNPYVSSAPLI